MQAVNKHKLARTKNSFGEALSRETLFKKDKFSQLVDDLVEGKLSPNQIQMAHRASISRSRFTEGFSDLLAGRDGSAGIVFKLYQTINEIQGAMELTYRRGIDVGIYKGLKRRDKKHRRQIKELEARIKKLESSG